MTGVLDDNLKGDINGKKKKMTEENKMHFVMVIIEDIDLNMVFVLK